MAHQIPFENAQNEDITESVSGVTNIAPDLDRCPPSSLFQLFILLLDLYLFMAVIGSQVRIWTVLF